MNVKLVSSTPDPEKLCIYIARVSSKNQNNPEIAKLVRYLINNSHWSPFEHSFLTFEIITSRAIAAQLLRHKSFSFQELSQRYSTAETWEPIELRKQSETNRQSSTEIFNPTILYGDMPFDASELVHDYLRRGFEIYNTLLDYDVARECARFVLPLATQTRLYMTGNLRSWIHYIALRTDEHTQKEHRDIANAIKSIFVEQCPIIGEALAWQ